jgi:hypothetical protein
LLGQKVCESTKRFFAMVPEPNEHDEPHVPYADYSAVLAALTNAELLSVLELGLL